MAGFSTQRGPFFRQQPATDYRELLARSMISNGSSSEPVRTPMQGIGRLAQALSGAFIQKRLNDEQKTRQSAYGDTLAKALKAAQGGAPITPAQAINAPGNIGPTTAAASQIGLPAAPGGKAAIIAELSGNPDTANLAMQMQMGQIEQQQAAERDAATRAAGYLREDEVYKRTRVDKKTDRAEDAALKRDLAKYGLDGRVSQMIEQALLNDRLARARDADKPYTVRGLRPPQGGTPEQGGPSSIAKADADAAAMKEQALEEAKAKVAANRALPDVVGNAERMRKIVKGLIDHPGMPDVVGMPDSVAGAVQKLFGVTFPSSNAAGFAARLDQLGGQQFLQAYATLKGGGTITEIEGKKATDAMSRLSKTNISETEYKEAAQELLDVIEAGVSRAQAKAGVSAPEAPPPDAAALHQKYGLE